MAPSGSSSLERLQYIPPRGKSSVGLGGQLLLEVRLPAVLPNTSGPAYSAPITGITGAASATQSNVEAAVARLKKLTDLPIAVGFGINTSEQVREIGTVAEAAVVGSAIVRQIENNLDDDGNPKPGLVDAVLEFTKTLSQGVR